ARRSRLMSASAATPMPSLLADNPRLDRWVSFPAPGQVTVSTGRVEIGQGVLTAMRQIAAEELDVTPERILLQSGDTELTPNEGYTAGSQSIQFGGVALRLACAEVLDGMLHARVVRQPRRGATIASLDESAIRRAAKGPVEIIRDGNFVALLGADETAVETAAGVAPNHVTWDGIEALNPFQEEARW